MTGTVACSANSSTSAWAKVRIRTGSDEAREHESGVAAALAPRELQVGGGHVERHSPHRCRISTTLPDTTLFTSTLTSGWTLPTSVTFTWMSATSALPTFTGSLASGFLPVAFMATNVMTIATARTMIDHTASFFLRFPLIDAPRIRCCQINVREGQRFQAVTAPILTTQSMKRSLPLLLAAALFCATLSAEQSPFRNASISYGGGSVLDMKAADVNHDGKQDVILLQKVK